MNNILLLHLLFQPFVSIAHKKVNEKSSAGWADEVEDPRLGEERKDDEENVEEQAAAAELSVKFEVVGHEA